MAPDQITSVAEEYCVYRQATGQVPPQSSELRAQADVPVSGSTPIVRAPEEKKTRRPPVPRTRTRTIYIVTS